MSGFGAFLLEKLSNNIPEVKSTSCGFGLHQNF